MTQLVKKFFILFLTVLVASFLSLGSLTVNAESQNELRTTDRLYNKHSGSDAVDITDTYYSVFLKSFNPHFANDPDRNVDAFKRDYARAVENGSLLFLQYSHGSGDSSSGYVSLFFNYKKDCSVSLVKEDSLYKLSVSSSDSDCLFRQAVFDANPVANYYGNASSRLSPSPLISSNASTSISVFSYSGEYVVDASAEGATPIPKSKKVDTEAPSFDWNDNCGLDIVCHLGNIGNAIKVVFSFILGIFDFSENNSLLKIVKWLFIPKDPQVTLNFSDISDSFKNSLKPFFDTIDLLKRTYEAFFPPVDYWGSSNYCSTSLAGDAGVQDSAGRRYIIQTTVFGKPFSPDVCSFERAIGGYRAMATVRVFTSVALFITSFFLLYQLLMKILRIRI